MSNNAFDYAIDAIERMDYVGFSKWSERKREAINRLALAKQLSAVDLARARNRGVWIAAVIIIGAEVALYSLAWHLRNGN